MRSIIFYIIIGLTISYVIYSKKHTTVNNISPKMLQKIMNHSSNILIIDVRGENEYYGPVGHIKGSMLLPLSELKNNIEKIKSKEYDQIYAICLSGSRSASAVKILNNNNINAENVKGGMIAWNNLR